MDAALWTDLALAALPFAVGMAATWRLVWPRWKIAGKTAFYLGAVAALSLAIGHWSVVLAWLHQAVGLGIHIWFSRRHGFTWYAVEDPERYVALSKEMVGYADPEPAPRRDTLDGVALPELNTMQCEGETSGVEWVVDEEDR